MENTANGLAPSCPLSVLTPFLQAERARVFRLAEKGELFVPSPSHFDVVYLSPDKQAVVPCRVTVLSAKVTLHREFPAEEIPADGADIVYDLKRGFVYLQPHSGHQGVVYCKAEAAGKSQISVKYQLLYAQGKPFRGEAGAASAGRGGLPLPPGMAGQ